MPVLIYLLHHTSKVAIAESLAVVGAIALISSISYALAKCVDWRTAFVFGLPGMAGTYLGAWMAAFVPGYVQLFVFAGVMVLAAVQMWRRSAVEQRLSRLEDGRLLYELRHRWRDGTTHVAFEPLELIDRLAALVPPPRWHTVRYYGVLASRSKLRARIVPGEEAPVRDSCTPAGSICVESDAGGLKDTTSLGPGAGTHNTGGATRPSRYYSWPELMRRVFEIDVLQCPRCQASPMRILAAIHPPTTTVAILKSMGLPTRAPPIAPARAVGSDWTLAESPSIFSHYGSRPAA